MFCLGLSIKIQIQIFEIVRTLNLTVPGFMSCTLPQLGAPTRRDCSFNRKASNGVRRYYLEAWHR